jgi:hypothetical protein
MGVSKTIYALFDPRDGRVRYIGATSSKLFRRCATHRAMCRKTKSPVAVWVASLLDAGVRPSIRRVFGPTEEWEQAERDAITAHREAGCELLNVTAGGMGCHGLIPSKETRAKRSATLKARYANDPQQMAERQELARKAGRSEAARKAASDRMTAKWAARRTQCR